MMKPLVIYHADCADGFGAAFAAWLALGDEAEYRSMQYDNTPFQGFSFPVSRREVYILDFSFDMIRMDYLFQNAAQVVWLDHHKSSFEMLCGGIPESGRWYGMQPSHHVALNINKSGAMLAWEYFHPDKPVPLFIRHIDDYDRYKFNLSRTEEFQFGLWSYAPWSFKDWEARFIVDDLMPHGEAFCKMMMTRLVDEGTAILRAHKQNVQSVLNGTVKRCGVPCSLGESGNQPLQNRYPGLAANCPYHLRNEVGNELAKASGTFGLCWYLASDGLTANCSLRSNGDYDVEAIAKAFGGGGHKNAAGFEVPIYTLLEWLQ